MTYIEENCVITHEGKSFESGGAFYDGQHAVAYVGKKLGGGHRPQHDLTDWHGNQIGTCYIAAAWRVRSYYGSHMCQIYAMIDGVRYTGRGFGEGMCVNLRRCAKQPLQEVL